MTMSIFWVLIVAFSFQKSKTENTSETQQPRNFGVMSMSEQPVQWLANYVCRTDRIVYKYNSDGSFIDKFPQQK